MISTLFQDPEKWANLESSVGDDVLAQLPPAASTFADDVDGLFYFCTWVSIFFFFLIAALLLYTTVVHRRKSETQPAASNTTHNTPLEVVWTLIPTIILMVIFGLVWEKPELGGFNFRGGFNLSAPFLGVWLGLSLYTGTYIVEIVRSGILAVAKGQTEAAAALGIRPNRIMTLVILPQALRVIIPQLISQYLNLTKNSSLGIAVGYLELVATLGGVTLNQSGREMEAILLLMAIYLAISLSISTVMNWYNNRVKLVER